MMLDLWQYYPFLSVISLILDLFEEPILVEVVFYLFEGLWRPRTEPAHLEDPFYGKSIEVDELDQITP